MSSENSAYDKELMTLYTDCKKEYPDIPDILLLMECQRYLKNPNQRTNKHQKGLINQVKKMKQEHMEQLEVEKHKWIDKHTFAGVSVEDTSNVIIENTSNVIIENTSNVILEQFVYLY